jgi:hypothetical protein
MPLNDISYPANESFLIPLLLPSALPDLVHRESAFYPKADEAVLDAEENTAP